MNYARQQKRRHVDPYNSEFWWHNQVAKMIELTRVRWWERHGHWKGEKFSIFGVLQKEIEHASLSSLLTGINCARNQQQAYELNKAIKPVSTSVWFDTRRKSTSSKRAVQRKCLQILQSRGMCGYGLRLVERQIAFVAKNRVESKEKDTEITLQRFEWDPAGTFGTPDFVEEHSKSKRME